ncbi:DUF952 domain-containing protein [Streptomyces liangshanensis]|uniref:DUF952 domain-containing protein n=1 Tax=Streptomyces liangshanensis TaxID=2717324 RepID=UPI0036DDE2CF
MIYHVVSLDDWQSVQDRPYSPASLATDGFVHCSGDEATTLAVVNAFYRDLPGTLLALVVDERKLRAEVRWEAADPAPPPGVAAGTLFPHVFGTIDRAAVERTMRVVRDQDGRATGLTALT